MAAPVISVREGGQSIDSIARELAALPQHVEAARVRALRKTQTWFKNRVKKQLAGKLRVPQKSIADRFYVSRVRPGDDEARVWIGGWHLDPISVGKPRQIGNRTYRGKKARSMLGGVAVGNRSFYRGAFLASIYSASERIWIRLKSKWYSSSLYPTKYRPGDRFDDPSLKHRFPVVRAAIPIDGELEKLWELNADEAESEFYKKFRQELNYELNVKGRNR